MKNKKFLILSLIILAIGFAAVSTTLYISGKTLIGVNTNDFEVYFSSAILDDVDKSNELITSNKKEIDFTTSLTKLNETSELEFEITNASTQYDADVSIICTLSSTDYLSFTIDKSLYEVKAQTRETGLLTIKLDNVSTEELNQTISCTLVATAKELDKAADVVLTDTTYQITGTGEPNTTYVVYSNTPHIVTTDDYGFFYVNGLEKGSHEVYYLGETSDDLTTKTKDEIKSMALDKANITTLSSSINFSNGNTLSNFEIKKEAEESVTLNLESDGSSKEVTIAKYQKGSSLEIPEKNGYTFDGWYDGDKKITDNTIITSDMDLQAKWNINNYTVTLSSNTGGSWSSSSINVNMDSNTNITIKPSSGYYLKSLSCTNGYTTNANTGRDYFNSQSISINNNSNASNSECTAEFEQVCYVSSGTGTNIGDLITCGSESFYIYNIQSSYVKVLAKNSLYLGGYLNLSSNTWTAYSNPTGLQFTESYDYTSNYRYGTVAFSNSSSTYSGSLAEGYVNNYGNALKKMGVSYNWISLLEKSEIDSMFGKTFTTEYITGNPYREWLNATGYWMKTASSSTQVWIMGWDNSINGTYNYLGTVGNSGSTNYKNSAFSIRPTLSISKSLIKY